MSSHAIVVINVYGAVRMRNFSGRSHVINIIIIIRFSVRVHEVD